jgi:hypothetical protein
LTRTQIKTRTPGTPQQDDRRMSAPSAPPLNPVLLNLVLAQLTPLFLEAAGNDTTLARTAAQDAVAGFRPRTSCDLLHAAQAIAFTAAALASLNQSMRADTPPVLAIRLRANANALGRTAERARKAITPNRPALAHPSEPPAPPQSTTRMQAAWAAAFADVAEEVTASLPNLSPEERRLATIRANALTAAARTLRSRPPNQPL